MVWRHRGISIAFQSLAGRWAGPSILHDSEEFVMQSRHPSTLVGVFEDASDADEAVRQLLKAGFSSDGIGVAMRHEGSFADVVLLEPGSHADTGAAAGALTGMGLGALAGLGVLSGVIPVVGPAIAGGGLGIILSNAAAGASVAGLVGALIGAGIPHEEARYYQDEFEAGRTIVTVHADDRHPEAIAILSANHANDMSRHDPATRGADGRNGPLDAGP
jgi:hypothetical protein